MNRTREKQEAAPQQAQDYVWGWRDVPATVRLDKICCYLDAKAMGRLEICGKNCLGDAPRAWNTKAAGLARGTLGDLSTKQFLRAQTAPGRWCRGGSAARAVHSCSNNPGGP